MSPVYIRISNINKTSYIKTSLLATSNDVKKNKIVNKVLIKQCEEIIQNYIEKCNRINTSSMSPAEIIKYLNTNDSLISFSEYCRLFIRKMNNENRESTSINYRMAIIRLEEFSGNTNLQFSDITSKLINSWIDSMKKSMYKKHGYPMKIHTMFSAGCREYNDYDNGVIKITNDPFKRVTIPRPKAPIKRGVEIEDLRKFFNTDISNFRPPKGSFTTRAERAMDVSLLIIHLAGINTADLYDMDKQCMIKNKLCYKRKKTRGRRDDEAYIEIKIPDRILPIIYRYKGKKKLFCFADVYANQKGFNKCINIGIKDIVDYYNSNHNDPIPQMTSYTFRHSWASIARNQCKASMDIIALALNHSSMYKVTDRYIKKDFSLIDTLNKQVLNLIFKKEE